MKSECDIKLRILVLEKEIKDYEGLISTKDYKEIPLYDDILRIIPRYREEIRILKWVLKEE